MMSKGMDRALGSLKYGNDKALYGSKYANIFPGS